jgi:hypothetical protein
MTPDELREAYRALQTEGSAHCPADEELAALAVGELSAPRRTELADHVVACRRCAESAAILLETHREIGGSQLLRSASPRRRWLSLAAAAAALAVIGLLVGRSADRPASVDRGLPAQISGIVPADGSELAAPPVRFAWPPPDQAEGYRLKLYGDGGELAWQSDRVAASAADVPPAVGSRLEAGRSYYWVVDVDGPARQARLGPFTFRIAAVR